MAGHTEIPEPSGISLLGERPEERVGPARALMELHNAVAEPQDAMTLAEARDLLLSREMIEYVGSVALWFNVKRVLDDAYLDTTRYNAAHQPTATPVNTEKHVRVAELKIAELSSLAASDNGIALRI